MILQEAYKTQVYTSQDGFVVFSQQVPHENDQVVMLTSAQFNELIESSALLLNELHSYKLGGENGDK